MDQEITTPSVDTAYFTSYQELSVHELMLKDEPRTRAYQIFIENHPEAFRDKIVMDVGAGSGILSLFAAKAGAKKVFAVEASSVAELCKDIVSVNGYNDIINVVNSKIEEADLPLERNSVDVIISEWMGFYLLHEAMLSSVIYARDQWLKPEGLMVPSVASIYLCPISLSKYIHDNITCWDNMYGFNFTPMKAKIQEKHLTQPTIETIENSQCLAKPEDVTHLHLDYVATEDLHKIRRNLSFEINKYGLSHGFACWFTCSFEAKDDESKIVLSTGPEAPATHWKQTLILLPDALMVGKGDQLGCRLELQQDPDNPRRYNISIELDEEDESEDEQLDVEELVESVEDEQIRDMLVDVMNKN